MAVKVNGGLSTFFGKHSRDLMLFPRHQDATRSFFGAWSIGRAYAAIKYRSSIATSRLFVEFK